ncbi:MAG: hypothetical protein ACQERZ_08460 [Fusobacteriota bacterium]
MKEKFEKLLKKMEKKQKMVTEKLDNTPYKRDILSDNNNYEQIRIRLEYDMNKLDEMIKDTKEYLKRLDYLREVKKVENNIRNSKKSRN